MHSPTKLFKFKTTLAILSIMTMTGFSSNITDAVFPGMKRAKWPHNTVYVQPGSDMKVSGLPTQQHPIPLGVPIEIETPLFKGKALVRFRNAKSDDPKSHELYFEGRKRLMQTVVQGRFKRTLKMSEVYVVSRLPGPRHLS